MLVDAALARLKVEDPELERIVVLKFVGGLSNEEVAETVGLSKRTLDRQWGLRPGPVVSQHQRAEVSAKIFCVILAKVVRGWRISGAWTDKVVEI